MESAGGLLGGRTERDLARVGRAALLRHRVGAVLGTDGVTNLLERDVARALDHGLSHDVTLSVVHVVVCDDTLPQLVPEWVGAVVNVGGADPRIAPPTIR